MLRKIIKIDEEKCDGCGICVDACHEAAIALIDGKAKVIRDDYCDGLGDCLPGCPKTAISFEMKDTLAYDEEAVKVNMQRNPQKKRVGQALMMQAPHEAKKSQLQQWPIQIKLVAVNAPFFHKANILLAADCTAYAYANFHDEFMKHRVVLLGCPKLDEGDYQVKLSEIFQSNEIASVHVVRMEVPCCAGITQACKRALASSGKHIPYTESTITRDGKIQF